MKMIIVAYEWPYPGDVGIIEIDNLYKTEFKEYSDQPSSGITIILRVKPCYAEFFSVFTKWADVYVASTFMAVMTAVCGATSQADVSKTNFPAIDTLPLTFNHEK